MNTGYVSGWTPLDELSLFQSLVAGLDFHLGSVQNAVYEQAEQRAEKKIREILPRLKRDQKVLKRLTNSAITPGEIAIKRTVDAVKSLPDWDDRQALNQIILAGLGEHGPNNTRGISGPSNSRGLKCSGCKKLVKQDLTMHSIGVKSEIGYIWHLSCWVASTVREALQEFRSTKGALDKQARSANAILAANEEFILTGKFAISRNGSVKKVIRDRMQFDHWIQGLCMEWDKTTTVKDEYRVTYQNYFKEYADQILEYVANGSIPADQTYLRLSKHLDDDIANSVVKRMLKVPIKTLRYLGLAYDPEDSVGTVPQYLDDMRSDINPESELDPELAWSENALCSKVDPEAFFPEKGGSTREAKKLCMACDVRVECLDYAMNHGERFGIWGGLSERERASLARTYEPLKIQSFSKPKDSEPTNSSFQISTVHFQTFSDLSIIGEKFRENGALILDMSDSIDVERKRAIDFLSGMIFAQNGKIQKIRSNVFFLISGNIQVGKVDSSSPVEADTYEQIRELLLA